MATNNRFLPSTGPLGTGASNFPTAAPALQGGNLAPRILSLSLPVLRNNAIMRNLVSSNWDVYAAQKGATIDIPLPPVLSTREVNPSATPQQATGVDAGIVSVALDQWRESDFSLDDREARQIDERSFQDGSAGEAINRLVDEADAFIASQYREVYSLVGQSETSDSDSTIVPQHESTDNQPFIDPFPADDSIGIYSAVEAGRILNETKCPPRGRVFVGNAAAQARTLYLRQFTDYSWGGTNGAITAGAPDMRFGFQYYLDQNIQVHTTGADAGANNAFAIVSNLAVGDTSIQLAVVPGATNPGSSTTPSHGDIFRIAGDPQTYVVSGGDGPDSLTGTNVAGTNRTGNVTIRPPLRRAVTASGSDTMSVTFVPSHAVNLAFNKNALMFATRPLANPDVDGGNFITSAIDPISGISLRLEVERQNKMTRWSFDMLYGAACIRPELITRIAGAAV